MNFSQYYQSSTLFIVYLFRKNLSKIKVMPAYAVNRCCLKNGLLKLTNTYINTGQVQT